MGGWRCRAANAVPARDASNFTIEWYALRRPSDGWKKWLPHCSQGLQAGDVLQQVGRDAIDLPNEAVAKLKAAGKTNKPVLMKVYRQGVAQFVAVSPRAA